jgi:tRNA threonylcarbamoyladenosine biosynthesis protein TsaB
MKVLAIDTSTKFLCLGLADKTRFFEYRIELDRRHLSLLIPTIKRTLEAIDWRVEELDYFAVGLGPGSFTGLRVGLATIKGLSWAYKKPVVGISTLDIIANNSPSCNKPVAVALDAKRNLIYCSMYKKKGGVLERVSRDYLLQKEEFIKRIRDNALIFGDALVLHKDFFLEHLKGVEFLDKDYWFPKVHNMLLLALDKIKEKKFFSAFDARPAYLYPKECQVKALNRQTDNKQR